MNGTCRKKEGKRKEKKEKSKKEGKNEIRRGTQVSSNVD